MSSGWFVNDVDLATLGWEHSADDANPEAPGLDDGVTGELITERAIDAPGEIDLGGGLVRRGREISVSGLVRAASIAALQTNLDRLKYLLQGDPDGICRVRTARHATREYRTKRTGLTVVHGVPFLAALDARVAITFKAANPFLRETADTVAPFTTNTAMVLGSAKVRPFLVVTAGVGGCTDPEIVLKNAAGVELARLTYDAAGGLAMDQDDELRIDLATGITTLWDDSAAAVLNGAKYRSDAQDALFWLDPRDGDWLAAVPTYPSLSGIVASGAATFSATYRLTWE